MLQRHDMVTPPMSGPAAPPGSRRATTFVVGVAITAVVAAILLLTSGSGAPAATSSARASTSAPPSAAGSPVGAGSTPDEQAPIDTPVPEPTLDVATLKPCGADGLAMAAGGWGGATGSEGGGATLINMSNEPCRLGGHPGLQLVDGAGLVIASGDDATSGAPVGLLPGGVAGLIAVWSNWCGDPPKQPLTMQLSLLEGAGTLSAEVRNWEPGSTSVPRCDAPGQPSTIGAPTPFAALEPDGGEPASSACAADDLDAFLGGWGAAAGTSYAPVVLLSLSSVPCFIDTEPDLQLRDAAGTLVVTRGPSSGGSHLDLAPNSTAITYLGFADWCIAAPKLPFRFDLVMDGKPLPIKPTSEFSEIGAPYCNSAPATPPPTLFLSDPFALPGR